MPVRPSLSAAPRPAGQKSRLPGVGMHNAAILLLAVLAAWLLTAPFVQEWQYGPVVESSMLSIIMLLGILAVGARGRSLAVALLLVIPALAARWTDVARPGLLSPVIWLASGALFLGYVAAQILRFLLHTRHVTANVLCAGLSGYLILGLLWVPAYMIVQHLMPGAFCSMVPKAKLDGFDLLYYSFMTLATVGYGDIAPVARPARILAMIEAVAGVFYTAVFISRLVAIYSSTPPSEPDREEPEKGTITNRRD